MNWQMQYNQVAGDLRAERNRSSGLNNSLTRANATIRSMRTERDRLKELVSFNQDFAAEQLDEIKRLAARSAEPGNENLRELSFKLYLLELCGAPYDIGLRGVRGTPNWLESLRMGCHRNPQRPYSIEERRAINLELLVRAEFYTFAKITKKLNAFQTKVLEALTMSPQADARLRDPRLVDVVVQEVRAHNEWIAQLESAPEGDLSLQEQWEADRLIWWKQNAAYAEVTHTVPMFSAMLARNPEIRVDDFHAAGRIAKRAGWHINDMEPAKYYADRVACNYMDAPHSFATVRFML